MQITFNTTATVIQQTCFRGNNTDELLTFNWMLQMSRGLCRWLLIPGNKWENYEHIIYDSSIIYISVTWLSKGWSLLSPSCKFIYWSYVNWSMNENLQQPQPHYWDQHDLSDSLLCAVLKRGNIYIVFFLFEDHMLNMFLNALKGRVYIKIHYCCCHLHFSLNRERQQRQRQ